MDDATIDKLIEESAVNITINGFIAGLSLAEELVRLAPDTAAFLNAIKSAKEQARARLSDDYLKHRT